MIDPANVPPVGDDELLARYVLSSRHIRPGDRTVKPDAFIPPAGGKMSVTRHRDASDEEIWQEGKRVGRLRDKTLHGRADFVALVAVTAKLRVEAAPIDENPNHANVVNWPSDKAEQKMKALELAAAAQFIAPPQSGTN